MILLEISICKWYNNAASPVLFFIDDFANVWVDANGNEIIDLEEDWGYWKNHKNSSLTFLKEVILKDFSSIKTTFFTPVGVRVGMIEAPKIKITSKMINCDEETKNFFKNVNEQESFEIAYHGTTHGKVGITRNDFKQEWKLFKTIDEAVETINKGKEIYKDVFGCYPKGGKYCGYEVNVRPRHTPPWRRPSSRPTCPSRWSGSAGAWGRRSRPAIPSTSPRRLTGCARSPRSVGCWPRRAAAA